MWDCFCCVWLPPHAVRLQQPATLNEEQVDMVRKQISALVPLVDHHDSLSVKLMGLRELKRLLKFKSRGVFIAAGSGCMACTLQQ